MACVIACRSIRQTGERLCAARKRRLPKLRWGSSRWLRRRLRGWPLARLWSATLLIGSHTLHREASAPRERVKPICSFFGSTPLTRIFTDSVREYIGQRKKQDAANRTINMEICILRRILKRAKRWHMMADEIPHLPERCDIGRALTFEEKSRLLHVASARPEWDTARLAAMLTLNTTMRGCELKGLCSVLAGPNPVHDAEIPKGRPAGETCAY